MIKNAIKKVTSNTIIKSTLALAVAATLLQGCTSYDVPAGSSLQFRTKITSTALKHFEIKLLRKDGKIGSGAESIIPPRNQPATAARSGRQLSQTDKIERILAIQLEEKLKETEYCRTGFWVIDKYSYGEEPYLRGECNETATAEDRKQFPDTLANW
ncbi:hypothetical protein KO528_20545 [Saccharophagus degradans]|uniref:hypothetical protein n=1 Tax=Saccharophagus degradans TaxID=86304 RepID=UPI001C0A2165|nr:hypothetical protein [Saccharophagus degradans]MBU2987766.1 hypothetical protein [Saccharophagus degradans]